MWGVVYEHSYYEGHYETRETVDALKTFDTLIELENFLLDKSNKYLRVYKIEEFQVKTSVELTPKPLVNKRGTSGTGPGGGGVKI